LVDAQPPTAELAALAQNARLSPIAAFCRGEVRPGRSGYAAAIGASSGGGRYVVLAADAAAVELAMFTGKPDLACYTAREARALNLTIKKSDTIHGQIVPRWQTAVVCGFVEPTEAVCWQYSPNARMFVGVGGWAT
jgi:hypothetical protein